MVDVPFWFNLMVYLDLYWYLALPAIAIGGYIGLIKMFTMPLLTRTPHELAVIFGPSKVHVVKVLSKDVPYFAFKKSVYWYGEAVSIGHNLVHLYFQGINQPITGLERNLDKESDVLTHRDIPKQVKGHTVYTPNSLKGFTRAWAIFIDLDKNGVVKEVQLLTQKEAKLKNKQRYKLGFFKRIGLYISQETEQAAESRNTVQLTVQMVQQKIGDVVRGTNFSGAFAYKLIKRIKKGETGWTQMLTGAFDMKIILIMVIIVGIMAAVFLLYKPPSLEDIGPPPPGI